MEHDPDVYAYPFSNPLKENERMPDATPDPAESVAGQPATPDTEDVVVGVDHHTGEQLLQTIIHKETLLEKTSHLFGRSVTFTIKGSEKRGIVVGCDPCPRVFGGMNERCTPGDWLLVAMEDGDRMYVQLNDLVIV